MHSEPILFRSSCCGLKSFTMGSFNPCRFWMIGLFFFFHLLGCGGRCCCYCCIVGNRTISGNRLIIVAKVFRAKITGPIILTIASVAVYFKVVVGSAWGDQKIRS